MHVKANQAYLIAAMSAKTFPVVVSVNRHQLQGTLSSWFPHQGLCPGPHWGTASRPQCSPHFPSRNSSGAICEIFCAPVV